MGLQLLGCRAWIANAVYDCFFCNRRCKKILQIYGFSLGVTTIVRRFVRWSVGKSRTGAFLEQKIFNSISSEAWRDLEQKKNIKFTWDRNGVLMSNPKIQVWLKWSSSSPNWWILTIYGFGMVRYSTSSHFNPIIWILHFPVQGSTIFWGNRADALPAHFAEEPRWDGGRRAERTRLFVPLKLDGSCCCCRCCCCLIFCCGMASLSWWSIWQFNAVHILVESYIWTISLAIQAIHGDHVQPLNKDCPFILFVEGCNSWKTCLN